MIAAGRDRSAVRDLTPSAAVLGERWVSRRPRVTIDARLLSSAGIGTYLRNLLPRIMARSDWRFTLLGSPEELSRLEGTGANHVSVVACDAAIYGIGEQIQLATRIPRDTDLLWSPHYNIPLSYGGRLLVTVHDLCHLALPYLVKGVHRRAYARFMFEAVKRRAAGIVCVSDFTNSEFRRLLGVGRLAPVTIQLGVSPRWFAVKATERPHPKPFLLFVGNIKPHKNLVTLIQAFANLVTAIPHDLVIVGKQSGFITGDAMAVHAAIALGGRIHFTGEIPTALLEQYFAHADAFVFPSLYEGFGLPPLESMAAGCPAIVSRAGSLPEVCGGAALYFDPTSPEELSTVIRRVIADEDLRRDLRHRGRSHAARFSWDRCAADTLGLMEKLVPV